MANISDLIEAFLLETIGTDGRLSISRNELAAFFSCAPSQINYVLSTRFTPERGYVIESRRGGGGSVTVVRLPSMPPAAYRELIDSRPSEGISYNKTMQILERMKSDGIINGREEELLCVALSDKALLAPAIVKDALRANILKTVLLKMTDIEGSVE